MDFKVIEFNRDAKRILVSHLRTWEERKEVAAEKKAAKKENAPEMPKMEKNYRSAIEVVETNNALFEQYLPWVAEHYSTAMGKKHPQPERVQQLLDSYNTVRQTVQSTEHGFVQFTFLPTETPAQAEQMALDQVPSIIDDARQRGVPFREIAILARASKDVQLISQFLIEKGYAEPMICVMPNGNPNQQAAQTLGLPQSEINFRDPANADAYVKSLCTEIVPFIEKEYRVDAKASSRAIAGLSMGGGHTVSAVSLYPSLFDYICPLSAAGSLSNEAAQALKKDGYKLFWLACGTSDFILNNSNAIDKSLTDNGLEHTYYLSDGGHTWANWRLYLNTFAQLLFK